MKVTVDTSELDAYRVLLDGVPAKVVPALVPTFKKAALTIKEQTQANLRASGNKGFRSIANAVNFEEPLVLSNRLRTKVGIDKGSPGSLGNIAVFGTWKGGGTREHPSTFAEQEAPELARWAAKVAGDLF